MDSGLQALAAFLIVASGLAFIAGGRRSATGLLLLGVVVAAGGAAAERVNVTGLHDRTGILPPAAEPLLGYAFYVIAFLVALNLIRHLLALFVGYFAADSAVGGVLSSLLLSVFAVLLWPFRLLWRLFPVRWD